MLWVLAASIAARSPAGCAYGLPGMTQIPSNLPSGHPLAGRAGLDLATLADAPWVLAPELPPARVATTGGAVLYDGNDVVTLLNLVAAGHGSALVPASTPILLAGVVTVPLDQPTLVHRTEVLTLRASASAAEALVEELRALSRPG